MTVAVWLLVTVPAVAVNVFVVAPPATVTVPGTVSVALLLDSETPAPPAGAAADNVTVHVDPPPLLRLVGVHATELTVTAGGFSETVAVCELEL